MLCPTCFLMLRGQNQRQWKGTYDLHFTHHNTVKKLKDSQKGSCGICQAIWEELKLKLSPTEPKEAETLSVTASLSAISSATAGKKTTQTWRLDFKIDYAEISTKRTFVLKEISPDDPGFGTTKSETTESDEVLSVAMRWLMKCNCANDTPKWYPTRLLDIRSLKPDPMIANTAQRILRREDSSVLQTEVKLVTTKSWKGGKPTKNERYVTLSHCWGSPEHHGKKLTNENIPELEAGIMIGDLPKTFSDAIRFAARLPKVGFVWIDSLCIKQGDTDDWLAESALMDQVYSESYLNISATAAGNSNEGLYFKRTPENLLENEITLNIDGIPVPWDQAVGVRSRSDSTQSKSHSRRPGNLRRCIVLDSSLWTSRVDQAPVNQRAWVLQERLLCPRVLHFCKDQVAWECKEFDAAEARPQGLPNYRLTGEGFLQESKFKGLEPAEHGIVLRNGRLRGLPEPVAHLKLQVHAFELWKRVVEVYSRTKLTNPEDKLIALSGIARLMATRIGSKEAPSEYIAGLWRPLLASQLLWKVEPVFNLHDNTFEHYGRRPKDYRAPTFSWAAIDADQGNGITYGEVTDKGIYISIEEIDVKPFPQNLYGLVEKGHLTIRGRLQRITLTKRNKGRFCWTIKDNEELSKEKHTNVYLDSVQDTPFGTDDVYCLPTAKGGYLATGNSDYIFCLLLKVKNKEKAEYERIGFTKLSSWADQETYKQILEAVSQDVGRDRTVSGFSETRELFHLF